MGFLKSLFDLLNASSEYNKDERAKAQNTTANPVKPVNPTRYSNKAVEVSSEWYAYFSEILRTAFPMYSVRMNVPVTDLVGNAADNFKLYDDRPYQAYRAEWGVNYDYVLYLGNIPKAVVQLGSGTSHTQKVTYLISRKYAEKMGMSYICFYTQFPNQRQYVIERIETFLHR